MDYFVYECVKIMKINRNIIVVLSICLSLVTTNIYAQKSSGTSPEAGVELNVYIPNAMTPDGNGLNDLFKPIISGGAIDTYDLTIYNRRGQVVFHSKDATRSWNGSIGDSNYQNTSSLYVYYLKVKAVNALETKIYTGHVVTIR